MHLIELVRLSFSDHKRFFQIVDTESPSQILAYLGLLYIWYGLIATPFFLLNRFVFGISFIPFEEYITLLPVSFALVFVFWMLGIFVWSAVVHAFVSMWGGAGRFISTLRCVAYSFTPLLVLGPLFFYLLFISPVLSLLVAILYLYTMFLIIRGLSLVHNIGFGAAAFSYLVPCLTVCAWAAYTLWRHGLLGV